jgi:hypothetical protein
VEAESRVIAVEGVMLHVFNRLEGEGPLRFVWSVPTLEAEHPQVTPSIANWSSPTLALSGPHHAVSLRIVNEGTLEVFDRPMRPFLQHEKVRVWGIDRQSESVTPTPSMAGIAVQVQDEAQIVALTAGPNDENHTVIRHLAHSAGSLIVVEGDGERCHVLILNAGFQGPRVEIATPAGTFWVEDIDPNVMPVVMTADGQVRAFHAAGRKVGVDQRTLLRSTALSGMSMRQLGPNVYWATTGDPVHIGTEMNRDRIDLTTGEPLPKVSVHSNSTLWVSRPAE